MCVCVCAMGGGDQAERAGTRSFVLGKVKLSISALRLQHPLLLFHGRRYSQAIFHPAIGAGLPEMRRFQQRPWQTAQHLRRAGGRRAAIVTLRSRRSLRRAGFIKPEGHRRSADGSVPPEALYIVSVRFSAPFHRWGT